MPEKKQRVDVQFKVPDDLEPKYSNAFRIGLLESGEAYLDFGTVDIEKKEVEVSSRIMLAQNALRGLKGILEDLVGGLDNSTLEKEEEE